MAILGLDDNYEQCSECEGDEDIESTYCGSFCQECLRAHLEKCDICRTDWDGEL